MKKKTKCKNKKVLYFDGGALLSLAGQGSSLIPKDTMAGGTANGAIQGATMGSVLGPWGVVAGTALGGIYGGIKGSEAAGQKDLSSLSSSMQERNQLLGFAGGGSLNIPLSLQNDSFMGNAQNNLLPAESLRTNLMLSKLTPNNNIPLTQSNYQNDNTLNRNYNAPIQSQGQYNQLHQERTWLENEPNYRTIGDLTEEEAAMGTKVPWNNTQDYYRRVNQPGIDQMNKIANSRFAEGGNLLTEFNGGYTHNDSNPNNTLSGIPQGQTPDGKKRTVEKGETKLRDFIFSDQLKVPKKLNITSRLPKSVQGKTFAKASKILNAEMKDRPYDAISKDTNKILLGELQGLNENAIQLEDMKTMYKNGGKLIPHSGKEGNSPWLNTSWNQPSTAELIEQQRLESTMLPGATVTAQSGLKKMPQGTAPVVDNRWDINNNVYNGAETSQDSTNSLLNFANLPNDARAQLFQEQGIPTGGQGVAKQARQGDFAGGVTWNDINKLPQYKDVLKRLFPNGSTGTPEEVAKFRADRKADPAFMSGMQLDPNNPTFDLIGEDWVRNQSQTGPKREGITPMPSISQEIPRIPLDDKLKGIPGQPIVDTPQIPDLEQDPTTETTTTTTGNPGRRRNMPNLWPEAGLLAAAPYLGLKPNLAKPTTFSTGYLKPQLVDEQSMRANVDAAQRGNIGALAVATGGSGAAQRAGLLGSGVNYMDATGNAFLQANTANNGAIMGADQFNIQNQTGVAGKNTDTLNKFELENKELINNINAKKADEFSNTIGNYVENGFRRRDSNKLLRDRADYIRRFTGYDPLTYNGGGFNGGGVGSQTTTTKQVPPKVQWASQMAGHQNYMNDINTPTSNQPANAWLGAQQVVPNYQQEVLGDQYYDYDPNKGPLLPKGHGGRIKTMRRSLK